MSQRNEKLRRRVERLEQELDAVQARQADRFQDALETVRLERAAEQLAAERKRLLRVQRDWRQLRRGMGVTAALLALVGGTVLAGAVWTDAAGELETSLLETETVMLEKEAELNENERIEAALIARSNVIEDCTVTWYTADTCGKAPGDLGYGITKSGLPVVEHLTCAVDPEVIPLFSDVFVRYADGTVEQLWATDTGVKGNALDIYTPDYEYAISCGRQTLTVYWVAPED